MEQSIQIKKWYCYKITNLINDKIYVGKTDNIKTRWSKHKTAAKLKNPHEYLYIHRAMNKYGFENFTIEQIGEYETEKEAFDAEIFFIKEWNCRDRAIGYNLTNGGEGSSGFKHSNKSKKKMSVSKKGTQVGEKNPFYGKTHSEEYKKQASLRTTQQWKDNPHPWIGRSHTEETKLKISRSNTGKKYSDEQRKQQSLRNKGNIRCISNAKLSEYEIVLIKQFLINAEFTHKYIADLFGTSRVTITNINIGKTWNHIKCYDTDYMDFIL